MAGTIGLTGLLSSDDADNTKDLYRILNTSTDPFTASVNASFPAVDVSAFESTSPVAKDMESDIGSWTGSFTGRYPKNAAAMGHEGLVTFSSGYVLGCSGWSITLNCEAYDDTEFASTPPSWRSFIPGEITATGSFDVRVDDTTPLTLGTTGSATFRMNTETTNDNELSGTIRITGVQPTVARGAKNVATYNFAFDGNVTSAGDNALFTAGALATPDLTAIVLRAAGAIDYDGDAFWTSLTINTRIGSPIEVSGSLQGSGALTAGS